MCRTTNVASVLIYGTYQPHDAHLIGQDKKYAAKADYAEAPRVSNSREDDRERAGCVVPLSWACGWWRLKVSKVASIRSM